LAVLAIGALIVGSILLIPMDLHVILHGQLTLRQLEFGETEWAIEADVDEYQLEQLHTHPIKAGESFDVRYFLSSEPEKKRDGWLSLNEVDAAESRMQNGKSTIFVNISQKADWVRPHPATAATVKVAFDRKPLGYAWIYQLIRFTRSHWRF
jgi:hypothetical protein